MLEERHGLLPRKDEKENIFRYIIILIIIVLGDLGHANNSYRIFFTISYTVCCGITKCGRIFFLIFLQKYIFYLLCRVNLDLAVENETMKKELLDKTKLLREAYEALETREMEQLRERSELESRITNLQSILEQQTNSINGST